MARKPYTKRRKNPRPPSSKNKPRKALTYRRKKPIPVHMPVQALLTTRRRRKSVLPRQEIFKRQPGLCSVINKRKNCRAYPYRESCVWKTKEGCRKRTRPYKPRKHKSRS